MTGQRNIKKIDLLINLYFNYSLIYDHLVFVLAENNGIKISARHLKQDVVDFMKQEEKRTRVTSWISDHVRKMSRQSEEGD
ncbi:hypothetical protein KUTeg_016149 [Tegillarca granosa]|uniref:Uncharacterized protein n=1 Tax=Tegillarca granosa TaxID=220873 RepID=A0ABQ9EB97_TEGGR|nr:hypothetical protein KUTeg_018846 [Tegillarca granosa]KAJ8305604.1 hypothetical protein KUTeg_016149 [Tegillarca granosa]